MSAKKGLFTKVGKTRIIPLGAKILAIFISLILISNFATNIISIELSQKEILTLNNKILVDQLKELYNNASNQYQIYSYSKNRYESMTSMNKVAKAGFNNPHSMACGVTQDGLMGFMVSNEDGVLWNRFTDAQILNQMNQDKKNNINEGSIHFFYDGEEYFGIYKYHTDWDFYLLRAEKMSDLSNNSKRVYLYISLIIIFLTVLFIIVGSLIVNREFRTVRQITNDLYEMQRRKQLDIIDLSNATNDDITYLAASFNSLSSSVSNLLGTFQKFVSKDVVHKAYTDQRIALEGSQRELTMLFSDIKSFTYRTETLGNDIIDVLNVHYNKVIHNVHENNGVVGSIIGDAILAIYGTMDSSMSKSYNAIKAAWDITHETASLRQTMQERRVEVEKRRVLTESEERVFQAVLLDVGVGIDGGTVFYGNIGSNEHMANTVIGDNVNSASRLEGLTRIYHLPVIVSAYIKEEVEKESDRYKFFEIDMVQVKGKTEGKKIYFPFDTQEMDNALIEKYNIFENGLAAYYSGDWKTARKEFKDCELDVSQVFLERMGLKSAPEDWSGIWTMTTK